MKLVDLEVAKRTVSGKGGARSLRREGRIPGIIYGEGQDPLAISVDRQTIEKALHSGGDNENILVNVSVMGESGVTLALVRETQHDPLTGSLEHLDFRRVSIDRPIKTTVPVHAIGTPKGVREGGILERPTREVEIECLPLEIPSAIEIDVSAIEIGHSLHVSDIPQNPQYTILTIGERPLVMVAAPKIEAAPSAAVAEGAAAAEGASGVASDGKAESGN